MSTEEYFLRIQRLGIEKLIDEEKRLYELLFNTTETSPIFHQLQGMLDIVQTALQDAQFMERHKSSPASEVIEIGRIDEVVYTPDYSSEELLLAVVDLYVSKGAKQ